MASIKYYLVKILFSPLSYLPLDYLQVLGASLGRLLIRFNKNRVHIARCNIAACFPKLSAIEQERLLIRNAEETGKWFVELAYAWFRKPEFLASLLTVKNPCVLQEAFDQGKGLVLVVPHLGNWEMLNFWVPQHFPTGTFYRPSKSDFLDHMVIKGRTRGTRLFKADRSELKSAFKFLKAGNVIVILSDHLPTREAGVLAPFFNIPALTGKLTQTLARINESPVILATSIRKPAGGGFEVEFFPIKGMHTKDPIEAATRLNLSIEQAIRDNPEQYQWVYRRFASTKDKKKIYNRTEFD